MADADADADDVSGHEEVSGSPVDVAAVVPFSSLLRVICGVVERTVPRNDRLSPVPPPWLPLLCVLAVRLTGSIEPTDARCGCHAVLTCGAAASVGALAAGGAGDVVERSALPGGALSVSSNEMVLRPSRPPVRREKVASSAPRLTSESDLRCFFLSAFSFSLLRLSRASVSVESGNARPSAAAISSGTSGFDHVASFSNARTTMEGRRSRTTSSPLMGVLWRVCCVSRICSNPPKS